MTSISTELYLAIAQFAYNDFIWPANKGEDIDYLKFNYEIEHETAPVLAALNDIGDWELVGYQANTDNGFAAIALRDPSTGELVFSFRGTEIDHGLGQAGADIGTDINIALGNFPSQFSEAYTFFTTVRTEYNTSDYSFTGHSLGGGIAQFMTYATDGEGYSETFNAVSPRATILAINETDMATKLAAASTNSVDHVNSNDWVGMYGGSDLGLTIRHLSNDDTVDYLRVDFDAISAMLIERVKLIDGEVTALEAKGAINKIERSIDSNSYSRDDTLAVYGGYAGVGGEGGGGFLNFSHHNLDLLLEEDPSCPGSYRLTSQADPQAGFKDLTALFQAISALRVLEVSKFVDNNYTNDSRTTPPAAGGYIIDDVYYFYETSFYQGQTYSYEQIAYANYIFNNFKRDLLSGKLDDAYIELQRATGDNIRNADPLILDLDGDGIETTTLNGSNTFFDLDSNALAENTSWVAPDDGLLVLDRNMNGVVDNGNELFGDHTLLSDGFTHATSGFAALAEHDINTDGLIDENDSVYSLLQVWQDVDSDGIVDAGELKSLIQLGIVSIGLSSIDTGYIDASGNIQVRRGGFYAMTLQRVSLGNICFSEMFGIQSKNLLRMCRKLF